MLRRPDFLELTQRYPELLGRIRFYAYRKDKASHQTPSTKVTRQILGKEQVRRRDAADDGPLAQRVRKLSNVLRVRPKGGIAV